MLSKIESLLYNKTAWLVLFLSTLGLEITALCFQYLFDMQPCIMCIYQRVAILGILIASFIGYLGCQKTPIRLMALTLWGTSALKGIFLAQEHRLLQTEQTFFNTCDFAPNFPHWLPLHEWLPSFFAATGSCDELYIILNHPMSYWMQVIFMFYFFSLIIILCVFIINSVKDKH